MTQTIGQQPQAKRERVEIETIRSVNAPAHRVPSRHNLQRDDPRIGQRRRNQQARKGRRIAEATPVDPERRASSGPRTASRSGRGGDTALAHAPDQRASSPDRWGARPRPPARGPGRPGPPSSGPARPPRSPRAWVRDPASRWRSPQSSAGYRWRCDRHPADRTR